MEGRDSLDLDIFGMEGVPEDPEPDGSACLYVARHVVSASVSVYLTSYAVCVRVFVRVCWRQPRRRRTGRTALLRQACLWRRRVRWRL
jgi:hypothetical protein